MRKKITNEQAIELIKQCKEEIDSQIDFDYRVALSRMAIAERELTDTFTDEQKKLYEVYQTERQNYYDVVIVKSRFNKN